MLRVLQMGLGPIGLAVARRISGQPDMRLVGGVDSRDDLVGRDVGELAGIGGIDAPVHACLEEALRVEPPDVLSHATGSHLPDIAEQIRPATRAGIAVVSTCEELSYPFYRHPELAHRIDGEARDCEAVVLGTGVNPGFVMDKLVATLMAACTTVRSVRVRRVVDAARRREPFQRKVGAGLTPAEFTRRREALGHVGLAESAHMLADVMGVPSEREIREELRPVLADRRTTSDVVAVEVGQVLGIDQDLTLSCAGRERIRMELQMYIGARQPEDVVSVEGSPPLEMTVPAGVPGDEGTANVAVRCVRLVRALAPGLRTMLDVPLR